MTSDSNRQMQPVQDACQLDHHLRELLSKRNTKSPNFNNNATPRPIMQRKRKE